MFGVTTRPSTRPSPKPSDWFMPAEDAPHDRTWMCWPSSKDVWGPDLRDVQDVILETVLTIAEFEPVSLLVRPEEMVAVRRMVGGGKAAKRVELIGAPVDDLWARDTLPNFLIRRNTDGAVQLAAGHASFNGWGGKQVFTGDRQLAGLVAKRLGITLTNCGLTGEGGGIEVDGAGTVLAAASSWVNPNRNPGRTRAQVERALLVMLGAKRMIWVDGLAGHDITDGHIDTLARFVNPTTILVDSPAFADAGDPWVAVATRTREQVQQARTSAGGRYTVVEVVQPRRTRENSNDILSTYMNFYVCNGAVIAPQFGDAKADAAARKVLVGLFPGREVVQLNIDALAAGGGGIHCATQQQPSVRQMPS
jgi:agmatine deiminase